jgi:hypothetical protein
VKFVERGAFVMPSEAMVAAVVGPKGVGRRLPCLGQELPVGGNRRRGDDAGLG